MSAGELSPPVAGPLLLHGAGDRTEELAWVLRALARLHAERHGADAVPPPELRPLGDLEELFGEFPEQGWVLLDAEGVPVEDIGFLRRFLERRPGWQLLVPGEDDRDPRARALVALPRARWLPWPPDLEELRALLPPPPAVRRRPAAGPSGPPAGPELPASGIRIDLGRLLEERLTAAALRSGGRARYLYRCERDLPLARPRPPVAAALDHVLSLARACAGERTVISARAEPLPGLAGAPDAARVRLDFPLGAVPAARLAAALREEPPPGVHPALPAAHAAAGQAAALGAHLELRFERAGRAVLDLVLASRALPAAPAAPPAAAAGRPPRPEDPFA